MGRRATLNLLEPKTPSHGRLLRLMDLTGVNQAEIARRIGETEDWVSRRVRWKTPPGADEIERFAKVLRVPACAFVDDAVLAQVLAEGTTTTIAYGDDIRNRMGSHVLELVSLLSPTRAAVVRNVLRGLDEAGVE